LFLFFDLTPAPLSHKARGVRNAYGFPLLLWEKGGRGMRLNSLNALTNNPLSILLLLTRSGKPIPLFGCKSIDNLIY
jgi:hypothetical protein